MIEPNSTLLWIKLSSLQGDGVVIGAWLVFGLINYIIMTLLEANIIRKVENQSLVILIKWISIFALSYFMNIQWQNKLDKNHENRYNSITVFEKIEKLNYQMWSNQEIKCKQTYFQNNSSRNNQEFKEYMMSCVK